MFTVTVPQLDAAKVTLPLCFFTVTVNVALPVPLTLAEAGET